MNDTVEKTMDFHTVEAAIKAKHDEMKELVEKANGEAVEAKTISVETKNYLEKLIEESEDLHKRLGAMEQAQGQGGNDLDAEQSWGEKFHEQEDLKSMAAGGVNRKAAMEVKTTLTNATRNTSQPLVSRDDVAGPQHIADRVLSVWNALPKGRTASNLISFPRSTFTSNAGPQVDGSPLAYTEGATKPESGQAFSLITRPVETIAHWMPVSRQVLEDAPFLDTYLNGRMLYHLRLEMEDQVLNGSGSNGNLSGLNTEATAFARESPEEAGFNDLQTIRSAKRQLEVSDYFGSHVVLNPDDWYRIETLRINPGTDDRYIMGDPARENRGPLWGLQVIASNSQPSGTFLVGDFNQGATFFEKSGIMFEMGYQDSDNMRRNLVTLLAECRGALAVWRTEAWVGGSFS